MILIIDNYDSFTFNLYQYVGTLNSDVKVYRNDALSVKEIAELNPQCIILSPGPGYPEDAGLCEELLKELPGLCPILGVCLGHQAIGEVFGGRVVPAPELVHGKQSLIKTDTACKLFKGLPQEIEAARYHSLIVEKESLPECLKITAQTADGEIMAFKVVAHTDACPVAGMELREKNFYGVQFHPESVMTPDGMKILANFLSD